MRERLYPPAGRRSLLCGWCGELVYQVTEFSRQGGDGTPHKCEGWLLELGRLSEQRDRAKAQ